MCEFLSWIEIDDTVLFLTDDDLRTSRGKKLWKRIKDDARGHGAIREYFDIEPGRGVDRECTDFYTPDNFPPEAVRAIMDGRVKRLAYPEDLCHALGSPALAEYDKVRARAWAEYNKVRAPAWAEYDKVRDRAFWGIWSDDSSRRTAWRAVAGDV